ncbi:condensation domain-containing protein [Lewinella sp. IMCC34191]|uniref:condensation domain-containing protein n=1 Tax=Lewinella sp. IMCC34191 TaxID=2259172 RepID=UPI000E26B5D6|nr:condensation domain-containing protein [Lewinella sp. IMCC34191]
MTQAKKKIEAVYPLSALQRALLFNHRADPERDEGLIQMSFRFSGPLDRTRFTKAWQRTLRQHPALRASVHWENISQPVWVVHPEAAVAINWLDGGGAQVEATQKTWASFLDDDRHTPIELTKPPACRLAVLSVTDEDHYFAWTSHHILLDGWSAETILKDMLRFYAEPDREPSPLPTHKDYLQWRKQQDTEAGQAFWKSELSRHRGDTLFRPGQGEQRETRATIGEGLRRSVEAYARDHSLSLNTVMQGAWAVLLGQYFNTPTVCFGTTVSGRPAEVPRFEEVAGMYVNVLPKVVDLETGDSFFADIQRTNGVSQAHQYLSGEELYGEDAPPFNSLLTVQNYPWNALAAGDLRVTEYEGDMTSTYPLTCIVVLREEWEIVIRFQPDSVPPTQVAWFLEGFQSILQGLVDAPPDQAFPAVAGDSLPPVPARDADMTRPTYVPPRTATQLELVRMWSDLLPADRVGIDDDFFHLGGTSFLALRLFGRIEERFGRRLSPAILLGHRTVRALETVVTEAEGTEQWNNLVPLRVSGDLPPIFCFHAGEGHVLMYDELVRHLDPRRPVYALQPNGLDGASELDGSIEEMAAHYLAEIDKLGTGDPLILLAYCYSGAICLEIGRQLLAAGRPAPLIIGTDIDPPGNDPAATGGRKERSRGSLSWYWSHMRLGLWDRVKAQFASDYLPEAWIGEELRLRLRARRLKTGLIDAFDRYNWPVYGGEVLLLRSQSLRQWTKHDYIIREWRRLTDGRLEIDDVEARHEDMYRAPAVEEVARKIEAYLAKRHP